ncbi:MAG: hypothetical protein RL136_781 [Planctomycetota bacterium]|jgi:hypothetical protein
MMEADGMEADGMEADGTDSDGSCIRPRSDALDART